jgi:uncharacterized protein involved in exopolysaccharide biosynthesis
MLIKGPKSTRDLLRIIFRHWGMFLLGAAFFAVAAIIGAHFVPLKYTGTAIFEVGLEAAAGRISSVSKETLDATKERLPEDLGGYRAVEEAVETLGLTKGLPRAEDGRLTTEGERQRQEMTLDMKKAISIRREARSEQEDLVSVSYTDADPWLAENMPTVLVTGYINNIYNRIRMGLKTTHDFIQQKVRDCNVGLEALRKQRIEFETKNAGMLPDNPMALQDRIRIIGSELDSWRRQQNVAQQKLAQIQGMMKQASTAPTTQALEIMGPNPAVTDLKKQLDKAKMDLDTELSVSKRTEKHPLVQAIRAKIAQLEKRIQEEPAQAVVQSMSVPTAGDLKLAQIGAEAELGMANKEIDRLAPLVDSYEKLWLDFGPVRQEYLKFIQKSDDLNKEAANWQQKLMEVEAALQAQINESGTRLASVQNPQKQFKPSSPTMAMVMAVAILGGLAFGGGLVFLTSLVDRSITATEDAVGHFEIPVFGVISEIVTRRELAIRRLKKIIVIPAVAVVVLVALGLSSFSIYRRLEDPVPYRSGWNEVPAKHLPDRSGDATPFRQPAKGT